MFSTDVRQFKIRSLLIAFVLFSIAMGLITTRSWVLVSWGILILVGVVGFTAAFAMFFASDLIDNRRVDDRKLASRFFNAAGVLAVVATLAVILLIGAVVLLQTGMWMLDPNLIENW